MNGYRFLFQMVLAAVLPVLLFGNTPVMNEPNWPQFRGPGGLGVAPDDAGYPSELDPASNLIWEIEVPRGHSSPCIWGDDLFITARSGDNLETICIDRGNGTVRWRKAIEPEAFERVNASNSYATPTPVCDGERVYAYFGSFGLLGYDIHGNELWKKPLAVANIQYGTASSPVLAGDMLVITCDIREGVGYILAVDRSTGETVWRQDRRMPRTGWTTPVLWKHGDEQELVAHGAGSLISYDLKDGHQRWWFNFRLSSMTGAALTPVYAGDTLFVGAPVGLTGDPVNPIELPDFKELLGMYDSDGDSHLVQAEIPDDLSYIYRRGPQLTGVRDSFWQLDTNGDSILDEAEWDKVVAGVRSLSPMQLDALYAVRSGGQGDIGKTHVKWTVHEGIGQVPSPLFYKGRIYLLKHGGNVTCYDATTGDRLYGERVGPRTYYFASPVAADDKIYLCPTNGFVIVVQAGDEFKVLSQSRVGGRIYATPALLEGNVYLRTDEKLYAFRR